MPAAARTKKASSKRKPPKRAQRSLLSRAWIERPHLDLELRPPTRPLRTGVLCLTAAITLALAAGTFGIEPGRLSGPLFWHAHAFEARGGIVGQAELYASAHLLSTLGAHILALFLF